MQNHVDVLGKRRKLAWKPDKPDHRDKMMVAGFLRRLVMPKKVDLRPKCARVEDQGEIGSCTANSSTSAIEYLAKKMGRPEEQLSRLFVYYFSRKLEGTSPAEDTGCEIRNVMRALATYGASPESLWPYDPAKFSLTPPTSAINSGLKHQILAYYRTPNIASIRMCLAQGFPAVGGFSCPQSLMSPETEKTGIVAMPKKGEAMVGGHAVLFVGYDDSTKRLIFQNSWGTVWGDKGFGYLPYDYVVKGLADDFWTIRNAEL